MRLRRARRKALLPGDAPFTQAQWYHELRRRALYRLRYGGLTGQQYNMLLYSLATLQFQPSEKWIGAWYSGSAALMARQILIDMAMFRVYEQAPPEDLTCQPGAAMPEAVRLLLQQDRARRSSKGRAGRRQGKGGGAVGKQGAVAKSKDVDPRLVWQALERPLERQQWQQVLQLLQHGHRTHHQAQQAGGGGEGTTSEEVNGLQAGSGATGTASGAGSLTGVVSAGMQKSMVGSQGPLRQGRQQNGGQRGGQDQQSSASQRQQTQGQAQGQGQGQGQRQRQRQRQRQGQGQGGTSPWSGASLVHGRDLACVLWCLARVQHSPPVWWVRLYEAVLLPRLAGFKTQVGGWGASCIKQGS